MTDWTQILQSLECWRGNMKYKHYTDEQIDYIREIAKGRTRQDITDLFNEKFNQNRTVKGIGNILHRHKIRTGMQGHATQFKKGNKAWNKGLKREEYLTKDQIVKSKETQFKKGQVSPRRKDLGAERINEFGFIEVKTEQPDTWKLKHRHIWEEEHGEIPYRHVIIFKDGDKTNCELDNMMMIYQNAVTTVGMRKALTEYPEINEAIYNLTELEVKTNVRKKEQSK